MKRLALLLLLASVSGCAYLNGIYNARQAEKRGDALLRKGREAEAASYFATVAQKAETVLVRHGGSKWAGDARYLAGRGWARANQCEKAVPHLEQALGADGLQGERLESARLALGICRMQAQEHAAAESLLALVMESTDEWRAREAAVWAARSALARGAVDQAQRFLANTSTGTAEWELAGAFLAAGDHARAESLLVRRASEGDYRPEVLPALTALWTGGRSSGVGRIVEAYDGARLRPGHRARLHVAYGDLLLAGEEDSAAAAHFTTAQRIARDSIPGRQASARLTALAIRDLASLTDVEAAIARTSHVSGSVPMQRRMELNLLFTKILLERTDYTGASMFLAGEVARDSLGARALARSIFLNVPATYGNSPVAPKGLLAAAALAPDSADAWHERLRTEYGSSLYALALDGKDNPVIGRINRGDQLLQQAWTLGTKAFSDSLNAMRRAEQNRQGQVAGSGSPPVPQ